ncbi:hypothetical protein PHYPO_G00148190 [Pangasianodon hypophthalmus]|uniref:Ig-like domain-containing protein n=1 Tax=Pangasianodon hypophthalmus TaxID=310915 RepID=A0A5N5KCZ8_PANHP|nr:hypothetical protein PHYPO_G00148190 [Pangasianodon hypophthalmus]
MCSYSNIVITTGFWFSLKDKAKWRKEEQPEDLALDSDYAGRVSYTEMTNFSSTLTITDLRERDSGEYRLMFFTDKGEKYLSSAGVTLTVTDLQVTRDSTEQSLTCRTSCLLTFALHRYYWYRNGHFFNNYTDNMETFPLRNAEEGSYSCSVHGYNEILSPPLCDEESSTEVSKLHAVWGAAALIPALLLSLLTAVLCIKRKRGAERDTDIQSFAMAEDDTYTATNSISMFPDYDTLQNDQGSASGTYTTLNPATMSSDYNTLRNDQGSVSGTYTTLNPATMYSDYDTLRNVQGSTTDTYTTLNPATMSSDYNTLREGGV